MSATRMISSKTANKALVQGQRSSHAQSTLRQRPTRQMRVNAFVMTFKFPDNTTQSCECDSSTYIMDAAEAAKIELPNLCRSGTCCTCASRIVSGDYDITDNEYLEPHVAERGFALLCSTKPKSDLVIQTHQEQVVYDVAAYKASV